MGFEIRGAPPRKRGGRAAIRQRIEEHHRAGASDVALQLIAEPGADLDAGFRRLAELLALAEPSSQES
jgi:hypothetical protein